MRFNIFLLAGFKGFTLKTRLLKSTHKYSAVNQVYDNLPKIASFNILISLQLLSVVVNSFIAVYQKSNNNLKTWESPFYELLNLFELLIVTAFVQKSDEVSNHT